MSENERQMPKEAMILAAGFGKRLNPLTLSTPKPLIPLQGKPFLEHVLDKLSPLPLDQIIINTHYLAEQIHCFIKNAAINPLLPPIKISHEPEILDVGGGIANALPFFRSQPFYTINSDIWWSESDLSHSIFLQLAQAWESQKMDALLVLVAKENALFYEGRGDFHLQTDRSLIMCDPHNPEDDSPYIYTGIQLIHPRLLKERKGSYPLPFCFGEACKENRLFGIELEGKWCDAGTLQSLKKLEEYLTK